MKMFTIPSTMLTVLEDSDQLSEMVSPSVDETPGLGER
jgi:hypothetical protein